ncbi:hypothetical protein [Streptomyces sp. NPDC056549]|uniref:hypothetical protein n=1 Tax=Streptomyces sp. NPDC056549 TaxID=3345864 RepID=UPI00368A60C1
MPDHQRISTKPHESVVQALQEADRILHVENERLRNELAMAFAQFLDLRRSFGAVM